MGDTPSAERETRREIIKKAAYVAPAILSLTAVPAFAQKGSGNPKDPKDPKEPKDPKPPKLPKDK
jgi:hypothetical protein